MGGAFISLMQTWELRLRKVNNSPEASLLSSVERLELSLLGSSSKVQVLSSTLTACPQTKQYMPAEFT